MWTEKCDRAFQDLKKLVSTAPVLRGPNWNLPFQISSDASDTAIGPVFGQGGGHFAEKRTTHKVLQIGYYWPTIFKDAKKFVQACDSCQRAGRPGQADEMPLRPQLVIEPFERWALDFVGPISPSSNQRTYILVAT